MWFQRGFLLDSYETEREQVSINLTGVDLSVERADIGESPYQIGQAPNTAKNPISMAFADDENEEDEEVELKGGSASLSGTASSGTGIAGTAIVRIERHTQAGSVSEDIRTSADGSWSISGLLGGRYRVRAWVPGRFAMDSSMVFYLDDESAMSLELPLREIEPAVELDVYNGGKIYSGLTGSAVVAVTERTVDADGYITNRPVPGKVIDVTAQSPLTLLSPAQSTTNSHGQSTIRIRCNQVGTARIVVKMDDQVQNVALAPCVAIPPPTTAEPVTGPPTTPGAPVPPPVTTQPQGSE